jgi:aminopeptidase
MSDPRVGKLAKVLVNYSVKVKPGDWVTVTGDVLALPLINVVVEETLKAGGHPSVVMGDGSITETRLRFSSDEQLQWISPFERMMIEETNVLISLTASSNTRSLSAIDPKRQQIQAAARQEIYKIYFERSASKDLRWVGTLFPCQAYAQEAEMSLRDYEDFVYGATFVDQDDPIAAWQKVHDEQQRYVDWLEGKKQVEVKGPNVDLALSVEGRPFLNADGEANMPSGEIYTSPVEDSANGWIKFTYPAITDGREVEGIELEFKDGKVVSAKALKNEEFLITMLDADEGARYLGEFAIGTNYGIQRFTKNILFDEKIGGTIHLAVGSGFPEAGSKNQSAIHWDMICDVREESEIRVDGELLYRNGQFQI